MTNQQEPQFNTDFKYAIVAGWLIIPAIHVLFAVFGSILILVITNPVELEGVGLATYIFSLVLLLFSGYTIYAWVKRKRILPMLMIIFYIAQVGESSILSDIGEQPFFIVVCIIFIGYFIRSKRVKATFTE